VCANVRGISSLGNGSIWIRRAIGIDGVGAIVLLISLAVLACQIGTNLRANTNPVSDLNILDGLSDLDRLANDFVADTDRQWDFTPTSSYGVDIRSAHTTGINGNVDVVVFEGLEFELQASD